MKKLTDAQIEEISQELELGLTCFLHKKTGNYFIAVAEQVYEGESEVEGAADYLAHPYNYDELHPMPPSDGFEVMRMFLAIDGLDAKLRRKLGENLRKNRPFARFKEILQNRGGVELQAWYKFKSEKTEEWTRRSLEYMGWH